MIFQTLGLLILSLFMAYTLEKCSRKEEKEYRQTTLQKAENRGNYSGWNCS